MEVGKIVQLTNDDDRRIKTALIDSTKLVAEIEPPQFSDDIIRQIAMDVGKQVVDHIEHAYARMCDAVAWDSARMSIRNCTHNAIMEAVKAANKGEIEAMLERHDQHRREMRKLRKAAGQKY